MFTDTVQKISENPDAMHDTVWAVANALSNYENVLREIRRNIDVLTSDKRPDMPAEVHEKLKGYAVERIDLALKSIGY